MSTSSQTSQATTSPSQVNDLTANAAIMARLSATPNLPADLHIEDQGTLLKQGVLTIVSKRRSWGWGTASPDRGHLFLFQKTILLCGVNGDQEKMDYRVHISMNKVRVRDVAEDSSPSFELHKLATLDKDKRKGDIVVRLACKNDEERKEWVSAINTEVKALRDCQNVLANPERRNS